MRQVAGAFRPKGLPLRINRVVRMSLLAGAGCPIAGSSLIFTEAGSGTTRADQQERVFDFN